MHNILIYFHYNNKKDNKLVSYMFLHIDIKFRNSQKRMALFGKTKELKQIRFYNNGNRFVASQ